MNDSLQRKKRGTHLVHNMRLRGESFWQPGVQRSGRTKATVCTCRRSVVHLERSVIRVRAENREARASTSCLIPEKKIIPILVSSASPDEKLKKNPTSSMPVKGCKVRLEVPRRKAGMTAPRETAWLRFDRAL